MNDLLWLLLPVAAASGWWVARREYASGGLLGGNRWNNRRNLAQRFSGVTAHSATTPLASVDQDSTETQLALGNLFRRRGEVERAVSIHSQLLTTLPLSAQQRSQVLLELGEDYQRAGLLDRAESLYQELVGQFDYATVALTRLVAIYEQGKDWQQAIEYSNRLEQLTGQSRRVETAHYYCEQAEVAWQRQQMAPAQAELRQALSRDTNCVRASLLQGRFSLEQGDYVAAITALHAVERQDSRFLSETVRLLNQCYAALQRQSELLAYLRTVRDREQTGRVTVAVAELLAQQVGEAAALAFLEAELQGRPTLLGLCRLLELKLATGDREGPVELLAIYRISKQLFDQAAGYRCECCGFASKTLHWQCPRCKHWSSMLPVAVKQATGGFETGT